MQVFRAELSNPNHFIVAYKINEIESNSKFERVTSGQSDMANKYIQSYTYSSILEKSFVTTYAEHFFGATHTHTHQAH